MKLIFNNPWIRTLAVTFLALSVLAITGCSGCRDESVGDKEVAKKKQDEEKKEKKKKPDFESRKSVLMPGYFPDPTKEENQDIEDPLSDAVAQLNNPLRSKNRAKLGHWYTASVSTISNHFNFEGQLAAHPIDARNRALIIPATDYALTTTRPVSLPKGEWKNLETSVYLPPRDKPVAGVSVQFSLNRGAGGRNLIPNQFDSSLVMQPYQYHVVLMSTRPDNFKFLELTDVFQLRGQAEDKPPFYILIPTQPERPLPLPANALNMTTIAYLIWDNYDPDLLDAEHQSAILDWLHFGGQLILSGPDCLDSLQTSFLADYLPAHFDSSRNLTNQALDELNANWALPGKTNRDAKRTLQISDKVPLLGVTFKPHDNAKFVDGTGEMVIERQIGRGRIVATAFPLSAPVVRKWRSFKSFLNGALLRRPARYFAKTADRDFGEVSFEWKNDGTMVFDPMVHSTLRFIARDLARNGEATSFHADSDWLTQASRNSQSPEPDNREWRIARSRNKDKNRNLEDQWHYGGYQDSPQLGTAGWNDNSGISLAARDTLREAAGISPPSSSFVLKMLAIYLIVLVPVNWLIFRLVGRIEFAWIAAPIISIVGAVLVVKMASLDIGFVRSNTQIGLLEVYSDYSRAHLTEYSALYTSLSTRYDADLDNLTAQSIPFAEKDRNQSFQPEEKASQVLLRRTNKIRLEGFQIQSNSTGMLHTESMLDLGGSISFSPPDLNGDPSTISNSSQLNLSDVGVIGRDQNGEYQFSWIGDLLAGSEAPCQFESTTAEAMGRRWHELPAFRSTVRASSKIWSDNVNQGLPPDQSGRRTVTLEEIREFPELQSDWPAYQRLLLQSRTSVEDVFSPDDFNNAYQVLNGLTEVSVGRMFDSVTGSLTLGPGEYRLIGVTPQPIGNTSFVPDSTQVDQQTLVVVHLKRPKLPVAERDVNAFEDLKVVSDLDLEREALELDNLLENQ